MGSFLLGASLPPALPGRRLLPVCVEQLQPGEAALPPLQPWSPSPPAPQTWPLVQSALSSRSLVCLRIQINPQNKGDFQGISPERAFADFLFASTILHLVVINFVG
ncbi:defender against cell death 1 [Chelydra serpentina]|uniref:Dolichyl-diphosphooligosaccharide--protein glycosyltransferase subunit DAD1 n=1 Tax=Chelydra serpentina TaxID=8475 RepID=A0A8T1S513_CHESE|nr:defender against cell death 1 [Chelydra serpentina]